MKGKMVSLQSVQGKTRPFYVMVQEHLYDNNVMSAPVFARNQAYSLLALGFIAAGAQVTIMARLLGAF